MALDLFKKVETRKGLFAVEKITLIYNLLTSILILFLFQEMDHPVQMLIDRAMIAGMTFLLMYLYRLAPCKFSAFVRIAIQMSLLSYWYPDTFEFNRIFPNLDHVFASAEQWLFNGQPAVWFCLRFPQMWVSEPFNMGYFFYYPMILIVVVWYFIYRFELFEKLSFVLVTSFFIYYLINAVTLNVNTRGRKNGYLMAVGLNIGGLILWMALQYGMDFVTGVSMMPMQALNGILLIATIPCLAVAAMYARKLFEKTNNVWLAAFTNTILFTLITVTNTAMFWNMVNV